MSIDNLFRLMEPLRASIRNLAVKGIVRLVDDIPPIQEMQLEVFKDESIDRVQRFQNYGFASVPKDQSEAVIINLGGNLDHPIAIVVDDRNFRPNKMAPGEVRVYHSSGQHISITDESVVISAKALKFKFGDTTLDFAELVKNYNNHVHADKGLEQNEDTKIII